MNIVQSFRSLIKAKVQLPLSRRRGTVADRAPASSALDFLSSPGQQLTLCRYHAPTPTHCLSLDVVCIFILFIWLQLYFLCLTKSSIPKGRTSEYIKQWPSEMRLSKCHIWENMLIRMPKKRLRHYPHQISIWVCFLGLILLWLNSLIGLSRINLISNKRGVLAWFRKYTWQWFWCA